MIVQCATVSKSLNPRNIDKTVSDIRVRIRFPFENSFWISVSGCKLTILPDIQPANRIVIISGRKTKIHTHGGSREYTLDGANTFTLIKHKLLIHLLWWNTRHTHEWRHYAYYNVIAYFDEFQVLEVYGIWNFWLRLRSCFGWIYSDSALMPKHFKVLDSDSCLNSKVNYLKAVAIDTPVDLEIWKLIHTPPVT